MPYFYIYGNEFAEHSREPSYFFVWDADISYLNNNCGEGQYVAWEIPGETIPPGESRRTNKMGEVRNAMQAYHSLHPDHSSDAWCVNSEAGAAMPYKYAGQYLPWNAHLHTLLSTERYSCAHCALVEARQLMFARGQPVIDGQVVYLPFGWSIPEDWWPAYAPEISGEAPPTTSASIKDFQDPLGVTCGNCGRLAHNSRSCEHHAKFHDKIGIEIEGRFFNLRSLCTRADADGMSYSSDGSLRSSNDSDAKPFEFKTRPGSLREALSQLVAYYPDEVDKYCGMHVHMSFPPECLTLLQTKAFYAYFKKRWMAWGATMNLDGNSEFFKRLYGDNDYCYPNNDELNDMTTCDRYLQLNFGAWRAHQTLECRLLPMFRRSSLGVAAVQELASIYEDFLADPEANGLNWADFTPAGVDCAFLTPTKTTLANHEIELPAILKAENSFSMELEELAPPAEGMVRIALPVNQPITVEALAASIKRRAA